MTRPRLLDLFCKAGGAAVGYWRAGFDVIGVDIEPQPHYPFPFWQADALQILSTVRRGDVDAIHASPPCQAFSALRNMKNAKEDHVDLLTPARLLLARTGVPFVIENVPGAPMRRDFVLCGTMFGLGTADAQLRRHRWFEVSFRPSALVPPCSHTRTKCVEVYGHPSWRRLSRPHTPSSSVGNCCVTSAPRNGPAVECSRGHRPPSRTLHQDNPRRDG